MRPDLVVIRGVVLEDVAQVRFAEHHQVVETFAPDRADETLDVAVLLYGPQIARALTLF